MTRDAARNSPSIFPILLCDAAMMTLAIAVNLMPVLLTKLKTDLGGGAELTNEQLGRLGAASFAGLVAGILATGPAADRWGAKPFTFAGTGTLAAGLLLLGAAPAYEHVLGAVFLMGLGAGILDMVLSPIVCALRPDARASAMNWLHSFYCAGAIATILIASTALEFGVGWRSIAFGLTILPALVTLGFIPMRVPPLVEEGAGRAPVRGLLRRPYFLLALLAIFLGGATELGMAQWLPAYAELSLGFSRAAGSNALLAFSAAMMLGRFAAGALGARMDPMRMMFHCCWTSVLLFIAACFAPWPGVALAASIAVGFSGSSLWPSMLGVAADRYPRGGASMFGLLAVFGNLGGIFMPWIVGVAADLSSMRLGLASAALAPLLMAGTLLIMRRADPHAAPAAALSPSKLPGQS